MQPLIEIHNLSRHYGDLCAVDDISFELNPGEVLGFLGPNGAGKSTCMRIISGGLAPSSGKIWINGIDLLKNPLEAKAQLGYLPEQPPLYPEMTVNEYLHFCARLRRIERSDTSSAVDRAKGLCGLGDSGRRLIGNLSKGYRQRTGIAQAIIHQPKVVILDEPTSGLDPNQIREIRGLIKTLGEQCGVILSTHILPEVEAVCDRVQILHQGRLVFSEHMNSRRNEGQQLLITLENRPTAEQLGLLKGIDRVDDLGGGGYRLSLTAETTAAMIAEQCVNNHWALHRLTEASDSLEQVFTRLTTSEAA
ncbi:MAG: ATP-binding cassette domain-containing protein [Sedimenticola sp.]